MYWEWDWEWDWDWYQRTGPGADVLGDVSGRIVAELGAGAGRQAAHVDHTLTPAQVIAIDSSATQDTRGRARYGHVDRLTFVQADAVAYLRKNFRSTDVVYSLFGALDFIDPQATFPMIFDALRPGGRLVMSTLAHYRNGAPPESDCRPADVPTRDGGTVQRWVLDLPVWEKLLDSAGFALGRAETIRDPGYADTPPMATLLLCAQKPEQA